MFYFFRMVLSLIKEYGTLGFAIATFILLCYVSWKLFNNHFKHFKLDIKGLGTKIDGVVTAIEGLDKKVDSNTNAISFINGKLNGK